MNNHILKFAALVFIASFIMACSNHAAEAEHTHEEGEQTESHEGHEHEAPGHEDPSEEGMSEVHLSELKFESLGIRVDSLPSRSLSGIVYANGQLEVPPQHEAAVTAIIGGNVTSIKVIEGDKVRKGQVLAYLAHPDFSIMQAAYIKAYHQSQYLEKAYNRQKTLLAEEVGSGQQFQEVESQYKIAQTEVKSYASQLRQLNLNVSKIREGTIYEQIPVVSPIDGYIEKVIVQLGQYVAPTTSLLMIVNTKHIHADLMVFEKDVARVKEGQKISFTVESAGSEPLTATIYSVGKKFEQNPKAVHVHAEIEQKEDYLIPGMYINGSIRVGNKSVKALPEEAIVQDEGKPYIFTAEKHSEDGETEWAFKLVEIRTGMTNEGWVEIKLLEPLPEGAQVAWSGAYYLISEMKKSQTAHSH